MVSDKRGLSAFRKRYLEVCFLGFKYNINGICSSAVKKCGFSASSCDPGKLTAVPPVYCMFSTLPEDLGTNRLQSHWRQLPAVFREEILRTWNGLDALHVV